jgi:amino acid permease
MAARKTSIKSLNAKIETLKNEAKTQTHSKALEHAWNHFSYHANQRLVTFRFYLIFVAIFISAYVKLMSDSATVIASVIGALGMIFTYVFYRLDFRNKKLIKLSESVIKEEEKLMASNINYENTTDGFSKMQIFERSEVIKDSSYTSRHKS